MPLDIALTGLALPMAEFPALAREAETRGYRTAWVGEASGAEAIVLSTLIATHTTTIKIANGVIPVQTRTPIVYGQAAATLGHLAPGRFALGLGLSSEIIVGQWHGLPFAPSIQQMREAVQIIRMPSPRRTSWSWGRDRRPRRAGSSRPGTGSVNPSVTCPSTSTR